MGSIDKNIELGNITLEDGAQLYKLTQVLYIKLYSYYEETESQCLYTEGARRNSIDDFPLSVARGQHNKGGYRYGRSIYCYICRWTSGTEG